MNKTPSTIAEVIESYQSKSYRKYGADGELLDWSGAIIAPGSTVEWIDHYGNAERGTVTKITDRDGALWDGSTDAALTVSISPSHTAICSSRSVLVVSP